MLLKYFEARGKLLSRKKKRDNVTLMCCRKKNSYNKSHIKKNKIIEYEQRSETVM